MVDIKSTLDKCRRSDSSVWKYYGLSVNLEASEGMIAAPVGEDFATDDTSMLNSISHLSDLQTY